MISPATIAIDCRKIADYGIGTYIRGLVRGLAELDGESRYRLLAPASGKQLLAGLPPNFEWVEEDSPGYSLREQVAVSRRLGELAPDLFHSPHYVLPAKTPKRVVVTIHDLIHLVHPEFLPNRLALSYARFMLQRAARRASRILTVSEATARDLNGRLGIPAARIAAIWNGVDERFRAVIPREDLAGRLSALGLEPGYFLFVGNPKPHKNLETLLAAFAGLDSASSRLVIVGEKGAHREKDRDARVVSIGRIEDPLLPVLYAGAAALVFPSLYEGFGLPVVEAMASGTPVIVSTTPAVAEVAGAAALQVDPLDVSEWTRAMRRILTEPGLSDELSLRGRERAAAFSWNETARRTLAIYREVLAEGAGGPA
jgi:glycosyltransferase involved in cell wall biosynthesis